MSKFKVGDKVRKITGYPFVGTVCAAYENEDKCCVKHKDKWEHIFSDKQLVLDHPEYQYLDLLQDVLDNGVYREGRNGGTYGVFGRQIRFNLADGFPLLTTKKVHWKSVAVELLWFIRGDTNIEYLTDRGVSIWDEWVDENGDLGPVYGAQWRNFNYYYSPDSPPGGTGLDQLNDVVESLKKDPFSRRHLIVAWNPLLIDEMALPPCHCLFQFFVVNGKLSCQLYQRSADLFLGVPFNIASYALLTHLIAKEAGLQVGEFIHTFGDLHLYANHIEQAKEQVQRQPLPMPYITLPSNKSMFDETLEWTDIELHHYNHLPHIKAEVSK